MLIVLNSDKQFNVNYNGNLALLGCNRLAMSFGFFKRSINYKMFKEIVYDLGLSQELLTFPIY
jgi:hypothetical protein